MKNPTLKILASFERNKEWYFTVEIRIPQDNGASYIIKDINLYDELEIPIYETKTNTRTEDTKNID